MRITSDFLNVQNKIYDNPPEKLVEIFNEFFMRNFIQKFRYIVNESNELAVSEVMNFYTAFRLANMDDYNAEIASRLIDEDCFGNYEPPKGLFLWGNSGSGKTRLFQILAAALKINFYPISDIEHRWLQSNGNEWLFGFMRCFSNKPIIIDDLGAERSSLNYGNESFVRNYLEHRLELFDSNIVPTLFTTNFANIDDFESIYGSRAKSRLLAACKIIKLVQYDWRLHTKTTKSRA